MTLIGSEQLYDRPSDDAGTGLYLSPQTIAPLGFSADTGFFLVSTWVGDKWIRPREGVLDNVEPVETELVPDAPVYLFDAPLIGLNSGKTLSGPLHVIGKWRSWYHIRTHTGDKWINPAYALPERLRPPEEPITLDTKATLYKYPFGLSGEVGVIDPQTILPVERGDEWHHLQGDFGDGWVYIHQDDKDRQPNGSEHVSISQSKAIELARQRLGFTEEYALEGVHLLRTDVSSKRWSVIFYKKQDGTVVGSGDITLSAGDGTVDWFTKRDTVIVPGLSELANDPAALKQRMERLIADHSPASDAEWMLDQTPANPLQNRWNRLDGSSASFRYIRTVNGLPFPDNYFQVTVHPNRDEISYDLLWSDNKRFNGIEQEQRMTQEEAELAFADAFLAKTIYRTPPVSRDQMSPVHAIVPRLYDTLDAMDGHWIDSSGTMEVRGPVTWKPLAEMPGENLNLSLEQAVEAARAKLGLPADVAVENAREGSRSWLFQVKVPPQAEDRAASYFVEVSTVSGDIVQCTTDNSGSFSWITVPSISEAQAEMSAEETLRHLLPSYTHQLYRVRSELRLTDGITVSNPEYLFTYQRRIDGIWGDRQQVTVSISPVTGKWMRLDNQLMPAAYPQSRPSLISKEEVRKLMLGRYRVEAYYASDSVLLTNPSASIRYRLVPTTESAYKSVLDAHTGEWLDFYTLEPEQSH
ncbi:hypothetical protein PAECIP111802_02884 [Paenibacillus allorhizosphaerae]|uniref:Uncharacterized protein n=2 Tax=Paenibacillus allorhizosphaerae TaxID=2849866 RepID=A0ABN7TK58_9BACL|nr:hypothetical protein PAECIP111802_02884 [Paenibacillus allorhizosphaerae]